MLIISNEIIDSLVDYRYNNSRCCSDLSIYWKNEHCLDHNLEFSHPMMIYIN